MWDVGMRTYIPYLWSVLFFLYDRKKKREKQCFLLVSPTKKGWWAERTKIEKARAREGRREASSESREQRAEQGGMQSPTEHASYHGCFCAATCTHRDDSCRAAQRTSPSHKKGKWKWKETLPRPEETLPATGQANSVIHPLPSKAPHRISRTGYLHFSCFPFPRCTGRRRGVEWEWRVGAKWRGRTQVTSDKKNRKIS
ncbi:hypothetical protein P167DRAFT_373049 [Morchella conica CCBAS932]|uniref:Uncharacterized protein n=1 Tax=Morchella conica CCBAS932 TaxID=1392247 RepID=A0A3N4KQ68_9PEZI|nr:hypothetical protein P167DRAFT_373049 [Morchella conica CCBAS932]